VGRAAGFLAELLGLARLVAELVALKRALGPGAAPPEPLGGAGGGRPADPRPPSPPPADGRGEAAPAGGPVAGQLGPESAGDLDGRALPTLG